MNHLHLLTYLLTYLRRNAVSLTTHTNNEFNLNLVQDKTLAKVIV